MKVLLLHARLCCQLGLWTSSRTDSGQRVNAAAPRGEVSAAYLRVECAWVKADVAPGVSHFKYDIHHGQLLLQLSLCPGNVPGIPLHKPSLRSSWLTLRGRYKAQTYGVMLTSLGESVRCTI